MAECNNGDNPNGSGSHFKEANENTRKAGYNNTNVNTEDETQFYSEEEGRGKTVLKQQNVKGHAETLFTTEKLHRRRENESKAIDQSSHVEKILVTTDPKQTQGSRFRPSKSDFVSHEERSGRFADGNVTNIDVVQAHGNDGAHYSTNQLDDRQLEERRKERYSKEVTNIDVVQVHGNGGAHYSTKQLDDRQHEERRKERYSKEVTNIDVVQVHGNGGVHYSTNQLDDRQLEERRKERYSKEVTNIDVVQVHGNGGAHYSTKQLDDSQHEERRKERYSKDVTNIDVVQVHGNGGAHYSTNQLDDRQHEERRKERYSKEVTNIDVVQVHGNGGDHYSNNQLDDWQLEEKRKESHSKKDTKTDDVQGQDDGATSCSIEQSEPNEEKINKSVKRGSFVSYVGNRIFTCDSFDQEKPTPGPSNMQASSVTTGIDKQTLRVVFHFHADFDTKEVIIEITSPVDQSLSLVCCDGSKGYGRYWKSDQPFLVDPNAVDTVGYKYKVTKAGNWLKSLGTSKDRVLESDYKKLSKRKNEYDVFSKSPEKSSIESSFAGQFFFVKMLYDNIDEDGFNLNEQIMECRHVGFGHARCNTQDRTKFFKWAENEAKSASFTPYKSAFICALLGQYVLRKDDGNLNLQSRFTNSKKTVSLLFSKLRDCPSNLLSEEVVLNDMNRIGIYLLDGLEYILTFSHFFDLEVVLHRAETSKQPFQPKLYFDNAAELINAFSFLYGQEDIIKLSRFVVNNAPNIVPLWKFYKFLITSFEKPLLKDDVFIDKFQEFIDYRKHPETNLLEPGVWEDMPDPLKSLLAAFFCDALINQLKRTPRLREEQRYLADLLLNFRLQELDSSGVINILKHLASSEHSVHLKIVGKVLKAQSFLKFWEKQDEAIKESIACEFFLHKVQSKKDSTHKRKIITAFKVFQKFIEIRAFKNSESLIRRLGETVIRKYEVLDLKSVVDAYEEIYKSSGEVVKEWYMKLLTVSIREQHTNPHQRSQLIKKIFPEASSSSMKPIKIDKGREKILLIFIEQAKFPTFEESVSIDQNMISEIIQLVLPDKELWSVIFKASGEVKQLYKHQSYINGKQIITDLCDAFIDGRVLIDCFEKLQDKQGIAELLSLVRLTKDAKKNQKVSSHWLEQLDELDKEKKEFDNVLKSLKRAINLVVKVKNDKPFINFKDFDIILNEYNDRKKKINKTRFVDVRKDDYWGPLENLRIPANNLEGLTSSKLFLNYAGKNVEEVFKTKQAKREEGDASDTGDSCVTVEEVLVQFSQKGVPKFKEIFEMICKTEGQVSAEKLCTLFVNTKKENIHQEFELLCNLFKLGPPSRKVQRMLDNYLKYDELKERIQVAYNALKFLYNAEEGHGSCDTLGVFESFVNLKKSETLKSISEQVEDLMGRKDVNQLEPNLVSILRELSEASELFTFIVKTAKDDMVDLIDAVEERSDQLIQESTVSYLIDVHRFLSGILLQNPDNPEVFLDLIFAAYRNINENNSSLAIIQEKGKRPKTSMATKIKVCSDNIHSLRGLYMTMSNRGEMTKETIKNAVTKGWYQVSIGADGHIQVYTQISKKEYNMDELNDLRSRALLIVNADKSNRSEVDRKSNEITPEELNQFIEQIDLISEITSKYSVLKKSGNPKYKVSFWKKLQSIDEIREENERVETEMTQWNLMLHTVRKEKFFLNFFHATQLWELKSFFQRPPPIKEISNRELALFRCIDNLVTKEALPTFQSKYRKPKKTDTQSELYAIGSALEEIFKSSHQKPLPTIDWSTKTYGIVEPGKMYVGVLEPGSAQTVHVIMALFLNTCASIPQPSQLLFCSPQTTWEEIEIFLLRTFEAHSHGLSCKLHCLANVESLSNEIQFKLVDILKTLTNKVTSKYLLAVVCRGGSHHHIADQFRDQTHFFGGMGDSDLRESFQKECPQTFFVTSDLPGLGKSEKIYCHAAETGKSLVSFPISGPFSRKILVKRLSGLTIKKYQAIHFDIGEVNDPHGLDTFLFELVVTGVISCEAQLFSLPTKQVYIEIANTLEQSMRNSLPVCKCFNRLDIESKEFTNMTISKEITSPVQVVCQYLYAYESGTLESQEVVLSGPKRVKPLDTSQCYSLLAKYFFSGGDLSFNVLENFISVLADQLIKFTKSPYFKPQNLVDMVGKTHDVRVRLFKALLEVATSFAARSINTCKAIEAATLSEGQAREALKKMHSGAETTADQMVDRVKEMIQWADNDHLVIMLHGAGSVTAIYRDLSKVPKGVQALFKSQSIKGNGEGLEDYMTMSQEELQTRLERFSEAPNTPNKAELKFLRYALTPDNILKMALIIQRMQANIPVIVMGETGCGKTSLVQYLAKIYNIPFFVFNFHAGITEEKIVDFISSKDKEARTLRKESKSMWVFLDEINTCDYLGTINEIVCHRSLHGKPLAPNLVFVAACNPYRLRPSGHLMTAGLKGKTKPDEYSKLVYRVHPLPETMTDYVWDYGSLSEEDEKAYIGRMVEGLFEGKYSKLFVELLAASQNFVRRAQQSSVCVSLRDVHRTTILIKWFYNILNARPEIQVSRFPLRIQKYLKTAKKFNEIERSVVLSLAHCYLSRLPTPALRQDYCKEMTTIFQNNYKLNFLESSDWFEQIIRAEQEEYLSRMELPEGTAKNAALRENIFVILVCILNRMPVFVVGKPGCSKSLTMQVLKSNLRGRDSKDPFLKTLPQLYVLSFQGSESSTSEGIEKVFERARKYKDKDVLPVVLLDEIGLAEVSKFNPLKVLHRLLEPGKGEFPDVAVVGISNWALDAAKMNRAIHLSRPEPDEQDLYETGLAIREVEINKTEDSSNLSLGESLYEKQLKCLAKAYHQYQTKQKHNNFHGLRDYYSMVKCLEIFKPDENNENIQRAMQRNFGGVRGKGEFQALFLKELENYQATEDVLEFPVSDLIRDNLHDKLARHLMVITNGDSAIGILDKTLMDLNKERFTIFGSCFEEDLSADYNYRVLSRIILCMEQNCVLILRDLEGIYGSLYDMLNQNYVVVGGKKNCRIALGPYSNPMCQVDDGFRCVVLVDEDKVDYSDPPFLNRFEKQFLRFSDVLDTNQKNVIKELSKWVRSISTVLGHEKEFSDVDMFAGYHEDTLPSLVLYHSKNNNTSNEDIIARCKDDLMFVASPDAVIRARKSLLYQSNNQEVNKLYHDYFEKPIHEGLKIFLEHSLGVQSNWLEQSDSHGMKIVVMTNSSIHTDVSKCVEGRFRVHAEKLSSFKSEKELSKRIQYFWTKSEANLLVVQCIPDCDSPHMLLLKSIIEQHLKKYTESSQSSKSQKHVCIVIHLYREGLNEKEENGYRWQFNFLSGWKQAMVDDLEKPVIHIKEMLDNSINDVLNSEIFSFKNLVADELLWCFTRIKYPLSKHPERRDTVDLVDTITSSATVMECFKKLCCQCKQSNEKNEKTEKADAWQVSVACDRKTMITCSSLVNAMEYFVTHFIRRLLTKVTYFLEKESVLKTLVKCDKQTQQECKRLLSIKSVFDIDDIPDPQAANSLVVDVSHLELQYPFSYLFFKRVDSLKAFFLEEYRRQCLSEVHLDEKEELTLSARNSLMKRVSKKVEVVIKEMIDSDYSVVNIHSYVDDALDIMSEEFSQHLTRSQRIKMLKAQFQNHIQSITQGEANDVPYIVTEIHSVFWMKEDTILRLLSYVQACMPKVKISIDEMITKFAEMRIVANAEEKGLNVNHSGCEDDVADDKSNEELHDTDEQPFEEFLIEKICVSLFPTDSVIESNEGVECWKNITNFVLATSFKYCHVRDLQVKAFHFLKVCYDFSTLIDSDSNTFSLYALGELGKHVEDQSYLDSKRIFESICESIEDLREEGKDKEKLDEFLFLLFARCIESNLDTPRMGQILRKISSNKNKCLLRLAGPILYRIFCIEEQAFSSEHFGNILRSPDDLVDFPNLIKVNEALSDLKDNGVQECAWHFIDMCCDLINRMAFKDLDLTKATRSDVSILENFQKAIEILARFDKEEKYKAMFGIICAVSYLRAFISALAGFLIEHRTTLSNGKYDCLLSDIFKGLEDDTSSMKESLILLLITDLKQGLCMFEIEQLIDSSVKLHLLKKVVCSESKLGYDPFQSKAENSGTEIALGKHVAGSGSQPLCTVLSRIVDSKEKRFELAAVIVERFYIIRSKRNLKDTEDKVAHYITERLSDVQEPYKKFLMRISNQESTKCMELEITPEFKAIDVEIAILVQHVTAIITSSYIGESTNPFVCCLVNPTKLNWSYLLAMPLNGSGYEKYSFFEKACRPNVLYFSCTCGTRFATRETKLESTVKCPNCSTFCQREEMLDGTLTRKSQNGKPASLRDKMLSIRNLNPVEFRILHLMVHIALFAGFSLNLTKNELAEFMQVHNPSEVCFQCIQNDLDVLSTIFCCTKERIVSFLHHVVEAAAPMLTEDSGLSLPLDEKTRLSWESSFSKLVRPAVQKFSRNENQSEEPKFLDRDTENREVSLPWPLLFRTKLPNSYEKLREFYLHSSDEVKKSHQLLGLFLDYHEILDRIGNLAPLISWSRRVDVLLRRSLTRSKAKENMIGDAVIRKETQFYQMYADMPEHNSMEQAFEEFRRAWEKVVPLFNVNLATEHHLVSETSPVSLCLVERNGLGQYLCATLIGLAEMQNEFLDKCLAIAASGNCPALQSLRSFPSVHVQDAKEKEIIKYQWKDGLLDHSWFADSEYGHGKEIIYDISKIEKDMAGCFLLGKAYLTTSTGLREFVFSEQLFHDCANMLNDLEHSIPQERLLKSVETELSTKKLSDVQVLLQHMEIVLCFLNQSGGKPDEGLLQYAETLMTTERPFPKKLLPETLHTIKLKHVCAMYEFLEDKLAVSAAVCIRTEYKKEIPEKVKAEMEGNNLDDESLLDATVTATKRFIFRYLNMKPPAESRLVGFMEDPSLWPISIRAQNFKVAENVPMLFPKILTIAHTYEVHKLYQERYKEVVAKKQQRASSITQKGTKNSRNKKGRRIVFGGGYN